MCRSKISGGKINGKELYYEGSITIDGKILDSACIIPGEMVDVLNLNSGARITTYVISGKSGSGMIAINGPASRFFEIGDTVTILNSCMADEKERKNWKIKIIYLENGNKRIKSHSPKQ